MKNPYSLWLKNYKCVKENASNESNATILDKKVKDNLQILSPWKQLLV